MNIGSSAPRFALVGIAATLIHVAIAVGLIKAMLLHPALANGSAFIVANSFSYAFNTGWSFVARINLVSWYRFVAVSLTAWLLTVTISWSVEAMGGPYLLGIFLVVMFIPALSYLAHRNFTYK
jgi:putative flippase GtrA